MNRPLGRRQIECLLRFCEAPVNGMKFQPTRRGEPWPVMQSLIRRNMMWAQRSDATHFWNPDEGWTRFSGRHWVAGVTVDGRKALEAAP